MSDLPPLPTLGLVLAGGLARRMGGVEKARIEIAGISILDRVLATLSAQCVRNLVSDMRSLAVMRDTGCPVVPDNVPGNPGPLAGILAGLDWLAAQDNGVEWLMSVPSDCPFLPDDLVERLHQARRAMGSGVPLACARSGVWRQPVVGLWPLALRAELRKALVEEDLRKVEVWTARHGIAIADWPTEPIDPFFNVNTPEDVERAARMARQYAGG